MNFHKSFMKKIKFYQTNIQCYDEAAAAIL